MKYAEWLKQQEELQESQELLLSFLEELKTLKRGDIPAEQKAEHIRIYNEFCSVASLISGYLESVENDTFLFDSPPKPLDGLEMIPFPVDCLPDVVADYVKAVAENTQTAYEMAGVLSLSVLAVTMQGKVIVQVAPEYSEQVSLYVVAIAEPGERKSAVMKDLTNVIDTFESEYNKNFAAEFEKSKSAKKILEAEIKGLEAAIIRGTATDDAQEKLGGKLQELADFKEVIRLRLLVGDITPERLIDLMAQQGGRIGISSAEGTLFDMLSAKNERGTSLLEPLLKGFSGDKLTVDRMGRESNIIEKPHISIILTVQPHVVNKAIANVEFGGRGLIARFLFVRCGSFVGGRSAVSPDIPNEVKSKYKELIYDLLATKTKRVFLLSPEAETERKRFYDVVEKRLVNEWEHMREFATKFVGTMLRIAGLIHGAENRNCVYISGDTVMRAIEIAECLGKHAEAVHLHGGTNEVVERAKYVVRRLRSAKKYEFTKGEMLSLCQKYKADELSESIKLLEDNQYIKVVRTESGDKGRPSETVYLNEDVDDLD